ncbi:MAG: CpsD/CapB family tyrosine-protein kinase [Candidatus Celaenobacter antarcticus]|nr:CpsD/CapB family tyrosine-protein kinase [Candidatus Celaenobacter antarcticus]
MNPTKDIKTYNFVEFSRMNKIVSKEIQRQNGKTILLTSGGSSEGKTFMAVNLALNFIKNTPQRVLLVDMNLRNPELHRIFGLPKEHGVTDIINDKIHYEDALKTTDFPNLKVITSGTYGGIVAQSFNDLRFVIEEFRQSVDIVIFESSPILVSNRGNIDPAILSSLMDIVLLVVLARKSRKISVLRSNELINLAGGMIFGVVMNNKFIPKEKVKKGVLEVK